MSKQAAKELEAQATFMMADRAWYQSHIEEGGDKFELTASLLKWYAAKLRRRARRLRTAKP